MSTLPSKISEIIGKWNDVLNAAGITNEEAVQATATMFGFVMINATAEEHTASPGTEADAHRLVDETVDSVHDFITDNYAMILKGNTRRPQ